jgi:hypothetical protein
VINVPQLPANSTVEDHRVYEAVKLLMLEHWDENVTSNGMLKPNAGRLMDWHGAIYAGRGDGAGGFRDPRLVRKVDKVCKSFINKSGADRPFTCTAPLRTRATYAAELYAGIIRLNPFKFGSHPIAFLALSIGYKRLVLSPSFPRTHSQEFIDALEIARPRRGSLEPLVDVLLKGNGSDALQTLRPVARENGKGLKVIPTQSPGR